MQTTHPGTFQLEGDTASGRAYISEFGRFRDGSSHLNYAGYQDRYQHTPDGWKFAKLVYEVRYQDSTPLAGSADPRIGFAGPAHDGHQSARAVRRVRRQGYSRSTRLTAYVTGEGVAQQAPGGTLLPDRP
jgi:hypothetical protein